MPLFFVMLPVYLFGNLHCLGMCGPLVMMIGRHRFRALYFLGRALSYSLAGAAAGALGAVANLFFHHYHLAEATSFFFGGIIMAIGFSTLFQWQYPWQKGFSALFQGVGNRLSLLMLRDSAWPTFLFGFCTLLLPCGQTLLVFSACALAGDAAVGLLNGLAFALLTSPSLLLAMQAHTFFAKAHRYYKQVVGISALTVGSLAILRGCAEVGWIGHWVLNPASPSHYHIVIF